MDVFGVNEKDSGWERLGWRWRGAGVRMAAVQCSKCTAERKGFRRELDSWRHRLIHCVGFETILEGIYGPMLLKDLSLFVGKLLILQT
uniref:Uncharacterized protein n=1 Tax=Oryzias latipes TaxID=8090 RepID=A0A3P9K7T9_ORYLA